MAVARTSSDTAFAQQGSLDWVALSNMPFNASIAVLGRLSRAGLEPLTIAIAQAVCSKLPVGVQGEQRLSEAMSTLKMHGSFGNVVWFGVGIRHILRTLVQTSQGASSVALTAALSEGFSTHVAALVLYELPKSFGSPAELTPSFAQWEQYVQVCSGIFSTSGFGQKISQHAKILGFTNRNNPMHWRASEAKDIANFLRGISDILNGRTESMEVMGSMTCSWAFILCDYIFGLRVQLCRPEGEDIGIIFQNYDSGKNTYQVRFSVLAHHSDHELYPVRTTFSLFPAEFKLVHHQQHSHFSRYSLDWRIPHDSVLKDFFGPHVSTEVKRISLEFSGLFGAFVLLYHWSPYSRFYQRHDNPLEFLHLLVTALPELKPLAPDSEKFIDGVFDDWKKNHHETWEESRRSTIDSAVKAEKFKEEQRFVDESFGSHCSEYLVQICSRSTEHTTNTCCTMLLIAAALCDVILDDPLELSRLGLARFYASLERFQESKGKFALYDSSLDQGLGFSKLLRQCLSLYTGDATADVDNLSAMSVSGAYGYVEYLLNPLQPHNTACRMRVGRGCIEVNGRLHSCVFDQDANEVLPYSAKMTPDFPKKMGARIMIEDSMTLKLWFEQWDGENMEERQAAIPGEAVQAGWYGSKGFWRGPFGSLNSPNGLDQEHRQHWMSSYGPL